jgi:hypothetical protein
MSNSTCLNPLCGTRLSHHVARCPRCGRQAFDDAEIARRGRHVALLGLILIAAMSGVLWMLGKGIVAALGGDAGSGFRGSPGQAKLALAAFGSMLAFGAALVVSGILMIARRSSRVATGLAILIFAIAIVTTALLLASAY